jgi:hypothetical protein
MAGRWDISWYLHPSMTGGIISYSSCKTDGDPSTIYRIDYFPLTKEYNPGAGGTLFLTEYGISDRFSIGIQVNGFDLLLHGLRDNYWLLYPSLYTTYNILKDNTNVINAQTELQITPLISLPKDQTYSSNGTINSFTTLSFNRALVVKDSFRLYGYLDSKWIMTFINPGYQSRQTYTENVDNVDHVMSRFAIATGIDLNYRKFSFNFGVNFHLIDSSLDGMLQTVWYLPPSRLVSGFGLENLELSWRYRL